MKKLIWSAALVLLVACGGGDAAKDGAKEAPKKASASDNPDYQKGLALVGASDCGTCHKIDSKLIGPAHRDVANKYPNTPETIDTLAARIVNGSSGIWGAVPMTPHPGISMDDAKQMAKYVMALKTN